jgi:hypothetical protein
MLNNDIFDDNAFTIQICCLIISPAFVSAGIYLTLKHVVINFGEKWSRLFYKVQVVASPPLLIRGPAFKMLAQTS